MRMKSTHCFLSTDWQLPHSDTVLFNYDNTALQGEFFDGWEIDE